MKRTIYQLTETWFLETFVKKLILYWFIDFRNYLFIQV